MLTGTEAASGDKAIDTKFEAAGLIVRLAVDCCVPDFAVMVTVPELDPTAMPEELMLATLESEEIHCAERVMSFELESE